MATNIDKHTLDLIEDFRRHEGQVTQGFFTGRPIILLTTIGAKSGRTRIIPLIYTRDGDRYVIVASKGGAPTHPHWYHNLMKAGRAIAEVGGETFDVRPTEVHGDERRRLYDGQTRTLSTFGTYEQKTTRKIPVIALERI